MNLLNHGIVVRGIVALDVEERSLALGVCNLSHRIDGYQLAAAFATCHDARNPERTPEDRNRIAYMVSLPRAGKQIVDNHVKWPLEGTSRQEFEWLQCGEARVINSVQYLYLAGGRNLLIH